jgi:bacterioferritin (cytochrome b1)
LVDGRRATKEEVLDQKCHRKEERQAVEVTWTAQELQHAQVLAEQIAFLGGVPVTRLAPVPE